MSKTYEVEHVGSTGPSVGAAVGDPAYRNQGHVRSYASSSRPWPVTEQQPLTSTFGTTSHPQHLHLASPSSAVGDPAHGNQGYVRSHVSSVPVFAIQSRSQPHVAGKEGTLLPGHSPRDEDETESDSDTDDPEDTETESDSDTHSEFKGTDTLEQGSAGTVSRGHIVGAALVQPAAGSPSYIAHAGSRPAFTHTEVVIESPSLNASVSSGIRCTFSPGVRKTTLTLTRKGVSVVCNVSISVASLPSQLHAVAWDAFQFPYLGYATGMTGWERRILTSCIDFCADVTRNDDLVKREYGEARNDMNLWSCAHAIARAVRDDNVDNLYVESSYTRLCDVLSRLAVKFNVFQNMEAVLAFPPAVDDIEAAMASAIEKLNTPQYAMNGVAHKYGRMLRFLYVMYPVLTAWYECCYNNDDHDKVGAGLLDAGLLSSSDIESGDPLEHYDLDQIVIDLYKIARYGPNNVDLVVYEPPAQLDGAVGAFVNLGYGSYDDFEPQHAQRLMKESRRSLWEKLNPTDFEFLANGSGGAVFKFQSQEQAHNRWYVLKISSFCHDVINCAKELKTVHPSARNEPEAQMCIATITDALYRFEVPCEYRVTEHLRKLGVVDWLEEEEHWFVIARDSASGSESLLYASVGVYNTKSVGQLFRGLTETRRNPTRLSTLFKYVVGYCYSQLRRLHLAGVCHGDPHVYNFMVTNLGTVQIIDWDASTLLSDSPSHTPSAGWSMFVPLVRDDDKQRQFSSFSTTKIVPAMEALFFFMHTFVHAGKPLSQVDGTDVELVPFAQAINAWLTIDPELRNSVLVTFSRLRKLLGAGNWLLSAPRLTHFHPHQYAILPSYTQDLRELGRTRPLLAGGELADGTPSDVARELHKATALEHFSQLLRVQDRVLAILDEFFTNTSLSNYEAMVAGRQVFVSTYGIGGNRDNWHRSQLDSTQNYPMMQLQMGSVKQDTRFVSGRFAVLDLTTQLVYTRVPARLHVYKAYLLIACKEYNMREVTQLPDFIVNEARILPGFWVCSNHSMKLTMPTGFQFNATNRKLFIWNTAQIDQLSPLWNYIRHESLLPQQVQQAHTRPEEPEDEPEFHQPSKFRRLGTRFA